MTNTTILKEYKEAGIKMMMARDIPSQTDYYWKPEMGLVIAENKIGDIGIVYKTKETLPNNIGELLKYIEFHSVVEDGVLSENIFYSITETRVFIKALFQNLMKQKD